MESENNAFPTKKIKNECESENSDSPFPKKDECESENIDSLFPKLYECDSENNAFPTLKI